MKGGKTKNACTASEALLSSCMNVAASVLGLGMSVKSGEEKEEEDVVCADTGFNGDACFFPDRVTKRCCGLALRASLSLPLGEPSVS